MLVSIITCRTVKKNSAFNIVVIKYRCDSKETIRHRYLLSNFMNLRMTNVRFKSRLRSAARPNQNAQLFLNADDFAYKNVKVRYWTRNRLQGY